MSTETLTVRIAAKEMLTPTICRFDLRAPDGQALPGFTVGAHINVRTPNGVTRSYSLNNDPDESDRYTIAVARHASGRGGSSSLVDGTTPGDLLSISSPSNAFELQPALRYLLIAGGIGITPIRAIFRHLRAEGGVGARLIYLTRSAEETAYLDEFADPSLNNAVILHHSTASRRRLDLWPHLAQPDDDTRVYCCGSRSLMDHVRALTMHWRPSLIHFEDFAGVSGTDGTSLPFRAIWAPTGHSIEVAATDTLLDALCAHGIDIPSSCESGTCGTCRVRLISGDAEHRDLVLDEHERKDFIMPCASRAKSASIEIGPMA